MVPDSLYVNEADTTATDSALSWLPKLQQEDDAAYSSEVQITNRALIDSTLALHDSLGVVGLGDDIPLYGSAWRLDFDPQLDRWDYNRVEGFLFGGGGTFGRADDRSTLSVFGGYATASEKFRYRAGFATELPKTNRKLSLSLSFRDFAEPFGSNRIALNSLRAFVGGADEQDYLHRVGGAARLVFKPWDDVSFNAGYEGARERSMATDADFSFFGDLDDLNPPIDEGDERAAVAGFTLGGRRWLNARVKQRLAGGALGGDFRYARTDVMVSARGFILGRQEFELTLKGVTTADAPPFQQLADIGGLSTVRGWERRTHVGNHSAAARLEYFFPYDLFASTKIPLIEDAGIQFIPWGDTAAWAKATRGMDLVGGNRPPALPLAVRRSRQPSPRLCLADRQSRRRLRGLSLVRGTALIRCRHDAAATAAASRCISRSRYHPSMTRIGSCGSVAAPGCSVTCAER